MPLPTVPAHPGDAAGPLLAGGTRGAAALRPLAALVADALEEGATLRGGPLPPGGPHDVAARVDEALRGGVLPERGVGEREALGSLVRAVAEGAADPADPLCAAHLHCPPLAVAAAADLAASALNPSLDSWDQAPAASELEARTCAELARLVHPGGSGAAPDAVVTTGGTESNQLGLLLARERLGPRVRVVCGAAAHHSVHRAAWLLGMPEPVRVPTPRGVLSAEALRETLDAVTPHGPVLVVATAGTTDVGAIDPLGELADVTAEFGVRLHVDAAYGGMLLFSHRLRPRLAGLERAHSVSVDLHKFGWLPVAAGLFTVRDGRDLAPLDHRAAYLNAGDDSEAGLPDLLGRSLRTTRRPDVLKAAVTLRALGRRGMAELVERTCETAAELARLVADDPQLELFAAPELSTVLFRPVGAGRTAVASVRRRLLTEGRAVLGRAETGDGGGTEGGGTGDGLWLKATLLNPYARRSGLEALLKLVRDALPPPPPPRAARVRPPAPREQSGSVSSTTDSSTARSTRP